MQWQSFRKNQAWKVGTILFPERCMLNFNTYDRKKKVPKSQRVQKSIKTSQLNSPKNNTSLLRTRDLAQIQPAVSKMKHAL